VPDLLVLCYHAVSRSWPAALAVTPARLDAQLRWLVRRGYRGVTFRAALEDPAAAGRRVAVTFDDAFRSVHDLALPILDRLGLPATVFVPTAFPGDASLAWAGVEGWLAGPHAAELTPLSWDELRALGRHGWEVGSHTVSHPRLTQLPDAPLAAELRDSRRACETALQAECASIAYPYGDVDARVVAAARAAGYAHGAALPAAPHRPRALEWPRVGVYHGDAGWRFALKASRTLRALRTATAREPG
jgi:peptidoglycan/xylan/chitin deacetylase (PgdA/CDA1 family)